MMGGVQNGHTDCTVCSGVQPAHGEFISVLSDSAMVEETCSVPYKSTCTIFDNCSILQYNVALLVHGTKLAPQLPTSNQKNKNKPREKLGKIDCKSKPPKACSREQF
jgi:hypothetical protein